VKSDLYAELFEGFAAAKAADASLTPRTQLAADNVTPMGTLEKRFAAKVEGSKTKAVGAGDDVNTAGSKILKSPTLWTSLEAGFQEATTTCPDAAAVKAAVTEGAPAAAPDADAAELRFAATLLASVAVLAPFA